MKTALELFLVFYVVFMLLVGAQLLSAPREESPLDYAYREYHK